MGGGAGTRTRPERGRGGGAVEGGSRHPCTPRQPLEMAGQRGESRPEGAGGAALEGSPPRAGCGAGRTQVTTAAPLGRAPAVRTLLGQALRGRGGAGVGGLWAETLGATSLPGCPQVPRTSPYAPPYWSRPAPDPPTGAELDSARVSCFAHRGRSCRSLLGSRGGRPLVTAPWSPVTQPCGQMVNLPGPFLTGSKESL